MKKKVIVPVDESVYSHRALQYAISLCNQIDGSIVLVNVQPNYATPNVHRFISKADIQQFIDETGGGILKKALQTVADKNINIETVIRTGIPKIEITNLAKELDAYGIVMGSRGMGPVKSALIGSVSLGVLQISPCPVTIVP